MVVVSIVPIRSISPPLEDSVRCPYREVINQITSHSRTRRHPIHCCEWTSSLHCIICVESVYSILETMKPSHRYNPAIHRDAWGVNPPPTNVSYRKRSPQASRIFLARGPTEKERSISFFCFFRMDDDRVANHDIIRMNDEFFTLSAQTTFVNDNNDQNEDNAIKLLCGVAPHFATGSAVPFGKRHLQA